MLRLANDVMKSALIKLHRVQTCWFVQKRLPGPEEMLKTDGETHISHYLIKKNLLNYLNKHLIESAFFIRFKLRN